MHAFIFLWASLLLALQTVAPRTEGFSLVGDFNSRPLAGRNRDGNPVVLFETASAAAAVDSNRNVRVWEVLQLARELGPIGSDCTDEEQHDVVRKAKALDEFSDPNPARIPLSGIHQLVYTDTKGGSSGKIGPFVGKVRQEFVDDKVFINSVTLGPLQIVLFADREIKNDQTIKVTFRRTTVSLFGNQLTEKEIENSGGVWKHVFSGEIADADGRRKLVRILETPSLFIVEKDLD